MGFQPMVRPLSSECLTRRARSEASFYFYLDGKVSKVFGVFPEVHGLEAHATFFCADIGTVKGEQERVSRE